MQIWTTKYWHIIQRRINESLFFFNRESKRQRKYWHNRHLWRHAVPASLPSWSRPAPSFADWLPGRPAAHPNERKRTIQTTRPCLRTQPNPYSNFEIWISNLEFSLVQWRFEFGFSIWRLRWVKVVLFYRLGVLTS